MRCDAAMNGLGPLANAPSRWYKRRAALLSQSLPFLSYCLNLRIYILGKSLYRLTPEGPYGTFSAVLNKVSSSSPPSAPSISSTQ